MTFKQTMAKLKVARMALRAVREDMERHDSTAAERLAHTLYNLEIDIEELDDKIRATKEEW